jgi:hypothetical protein
MVEVENASRRADAFGLKSGIRLTTPIAGLGDFNASTF